MVLTTAAPTFAQQTPPTKQAQARPLTPYFCDATKAVDASDYHGKGKPGEKCVVEHAGSDEMREGIIKVRPKG